jgi:hypothetical protein
MAEHDQYQYIEVKHNDRTVASAQVTTRGGSGGIARASFRAESGHVPPGHRASLVDAVLDLPEVRQSARLEAAIPLGDTESLHRLQERCLDVSTRPAGGSALLDAGLPDTGACFGTGGTGGTGGNRASASAAQDLATQPPAGP